MHRTDDGLHQILEEFSGNRSRGVDHHPLQILGLDRTGSVPHRQALLLSAAKRSSPSQETNHGQPKMGIPNRRKAGINTQLSYKFDYLAAPKTRYRSMQSR
jgi:hypothetical protein